MFLGRIDKGMFDSLKKMVTGVAPKRPRKEPEHIFMFDAERKRDYLMDLRGILRTPGARRALPTLHMLESTVTRNERRIRIPHAAMLDIIRELALVENRLAPDSPLREVMNSIPGLALSMGVDPMPTSVLMGSHELVPGELSTTDMNLAARRIGEALAVPMPSGATAGSQSGDTPVGLWKVDTAAQAGAMSSTPSSSQFMTPQERLQFLRRSKEQIRSSVINTGQLDGADLAAYFDLCRMSGESAKVIDALLPRIDEMPGVWAWVRLLEAADVGRHPDRDEWLARFKAWVETTHAELLPDLLDGQSVELKFGLRRGELERLEREELGR